MIFFKSFCRGGQVLHALNGACPCGTPVRRIRFDGWIVKVIQDAETVAFRTVGPNSRRRFNVGPRNARRLRDPANRGIACQSTANLSVGRSCSSKAPPLIQKPSTGGRPAFALYSLKTLFARLSSMTRVISVHSAASGPAGCAAGLSS